MSGLITRYRPSSYREVLGQDEAVAIFKGLEKQPPTGLLVHGPSGVAKTTLVRIFASRLLKVKPDQLKYQSDYINTNVGDETGIDNIRKLIEQSRYAPFGGYKIFVLDEAHKLTRAAVDALLIPLEDAQSNVMWILITSEKDRLPIELRNRLTSIPLLRVDDKIITTLLVSVCEQEKLSLPKNVIEILSGNADGSPRMALSLLQSLQAKLKGSDNKPDAKSIKKLTDEVIALMPNPEAVALNLLGAYFDSNPEKFIEILCKIDETLSNSVVRICVWTLEYIIHKRQGVKKKYFCRNWPLFNKLENVINSKKHADARMVQLYLKLAPMVTQYPLNPLTIYSVWN